VFQILDTALDVAACTRAVAHDDAGAIDVFVGTVRNHNSGHAVTLLEYQAYASMAEKELTAIARELESEIPGVRLACQHRVGTLLVGDIAVVCAASAGHRDAAFRACREFIDRIKQRVPIWKREHGPEGPYWVGWKESLAKPGQ
jgi:molybdopterin synthase catalytic subunit